VAQLAKALACDARVLGFESRRRQEIYTVNNVWKISSECVMWKNEVKDEK